MKTVLELRMLGPGVLGIVAPGLELFNERCLSGDGSRWPWPGGSHAAAAIVHLTEELTRREVTVHSSSQLRGQHSQPGAVAPSSRPAPHLLLGLQRSVGNRAATVAAQRLKADFKESFLTHIFQGEPNDQGTKVAGFHSEHQTDSAIAYVDPATPRNGGGEGGIYSAKPVKAHTTRAKVKGKLLGDKTDGSTFFPSSWTPEQLKKVIESGQNQSGEGEGGARYNRIGVGPNSETVPMNIAGKTIYPVKVAESDDEPKKKGGRGRNT